MPSTYPLACPVYLAGRTCESGLATNDRRDPPLDHTTSETSVEELTEIVVDQYRRAREDSGRRG